MIEVRPLDTAEIPTCLQQLAALRVSVFREYPYRYEGSIGYEREYLAHYARSSGAIVIAAAHDEALVGASTGLPLVDADPAFRTAFDRARESKEDVFYFGESVLLPGFRGQGIGHRFFDEREAHAGRLGFRRTAFCAVDRPRDDPHRPEGYRSLDRFWQQRGYVRRDDLVAEFHWREIGEERERPHRLTFWLRDALAPAKRDYQR
jgi:GNAT superfamily N-acetyltransferase